MQDHFDGRGNMFPSTTWHVTVGATTALFQHGVTVLLLESMLSITPVSATRRYSSTGD